MTQQGDQSQGSKGQRATSGVISGSLSSLIGLAAAGYAAHQGADTVIGPGASVALGAAAGGAAGSGFAAIAEWSGKVVAIGDQLEGGGKIAWTIFSLPFLLVSKISG